MREQMVHLLQNLSARVRRHQLRKAIAMPVWPDQNGSTRLGVTTTIELSDDLEICGSGFNARTLMIRLGGSHYYVFREDLERAGQNLSNR